MLCLTTCPDADSAGRIADALVAERLAACVSLLPGLRSTYRWEGEVRQAQEVQLVAKTTLAGCEALQARILELHPYALPELLRIAADGSADYLAWVAGQVQAEPRP